TAVLEQIKVAMGQQKSINGKISTMKRFLENRPEVVYLLMVDPANQKGFGVANVENFAHGAKFIDTMIQERSIVQAFNVLTNMQEPPNPYIRLVQDYWVEQSMQVKYAYLNPVHYFQWGMRGPAVQWAFYLWYGFGVLFGMLCFWYRGVAPKSMQHSVITKTKEPAADDLSDVADDDAEEIMQKEPKLQDDTLVVEKDQKNSVDGLDALIVEQEESIIFDAADNIEEEDDTKVDDIPSQVWIQLLDQPDLKDWESQGAFYVREDKNGLHAIGSPWASSIITRKEVLFSEFIFEAEGRVMTGNEGFALLFCVGKKYLTWILGGWENTQSIVLGYDATKTFHQIHPKKWYHIRIELEDNEVIGYIDGRTAWTLPRHEVVKDSPETGFQRGLGVGVFKTTTKFRNIRVLKV
ncbi:MAG: hypothetical protein KDK51_03520, partial [Deltaproteobacteria bacterium]|nr:hypothetical protein [Deltaproteobacteria bacterium]